MPVNEEKDREAWEVSDMIRSAGGIVETALRAEDDASRKALRDAAKTILEQAIARLDESVGAADAEEEEDE
ncbi:MAG: hypothetical protein IKG66_00065 [Lachnospiraceae bacterium]|nr:hypothetical protein [Lachnospiraceae bacterium]